MIDTRLVCQNSQCQKVISVTKSSSSPILSDCCFSILCYQCFDHNNHNCSIPATIQSRECQSVPCSRCRTKQANFHCLNCSNELFCHQCCRTVHSSSKFSFHSLFPINSVKSFTTHRIQKLNPLHQSSQKENFQAIKNMSTSKKLHQTSIQNKDPNFQTIQQFQHKVDNSLFSLNLKKSEAKIQEFAIKEKWTKIQKSIDEVFKTLQQRVLQKYESVKLILKKQAETWINDHFKYLSQIKLMEIQFANLKGLLQKNKKTSWSEPEFLNFTEIKSKILQEKMKSLNQKSNSKDLKHNISRQFLDVAKKISEQIQSLNLENLFKLENDPKCNKIDDCFINLKERQKKKVLGNVNKNKNIEVQTAKKTLNTSISYPDSLTYAKTKQRKISIELYDSQEIANPSKNEQKSKELQRIKSFDFLASINSKTSLQSTTEQKTQKKGTIKLENLNDSNKYPSDKQLNLNLNLIRNKIQNSNLDFEGDSDNFIKTSSELVSSMELLSPSHGTTRLKPSIYQILSPKGNTATKQKLENSNKTFSGVMNSPKSKLTISGFKSPNVKSRNLIESIEIQPYEIKTSKKNLITSIVSTKE